MKLLLVSVLWGAMVLPTNAEPPLHGGALVMSEKDASHSGPLYVGEDPRLELEETDPEPKAEVDFSKFPMPPEVVAMKDYLIARSHYTATVSVKYTMEDHNKYVDKLNAASPRDIKNWHYASVMRSQQAARGYALSQRANMMRIQQVREQQARNRVPHKRAATHRQYQPVVRNGRYPYYQPNRVHYWVIIR